MAYQMTATAVTLNDFEGHSLVAGLLNAYICAAFYTISTDSVLARFLCICYSASYVCLCAVVVCLCRLPCCAVIVSRI